MSRFELFSELTWPFLAMAVWVILFEGATFFLMDRRKFYMARYIGLFGALIWLIFGTIRLYIITHR